MKKWIMLSSLVVLLAGCRSNILGGQTIIGWVDFIKWDGKEYIAINTGALADEQYVGKQLGTVQFKVADNVTNPSYKTKDGDAAFHEKGTEIYAVEGEGDMIAVKDEQAINGYRIYYESESTDYTWHFKDLPVDEVKKVEIYEAYTLEGSNRIADIINTEDVARFLDILKNSKEDESFQPNTDNGDPLYYEIVLFTDESVAYKYNVQFDGTTYFWSPWDTAILSNEIKQFIPYN
ncbi:hypothetical protein AEA09_10315 [Lysinibacillus contaminans]|uniref:Lipoprotein n=1 Tax=Lysinibacillus contaminans TaxID=1293441 RepID=A0ABR5K1T5_9BACI|nr:hypothetical protein [Lysinibacillus contaminans]KOS68897.1 hypothetical protein AEA09_10315 [Lysinibacillus contaminans]